MDAPHWFQRALDAPSELGNVVVEGTNIHFEAWGETGKPGVVLIHGSNAHLDWWRFVAPYLADNFRVAALDLSGNGDSGWRPRYSGRLLADEVWAVCQAAALGPKPFVVGHSFGGFVALETGHWHGDALGGIIFLDYTAGLKGRNVPVFKIPGAYHHLMFDEPLAVTAAITATLLNWLRVAEHDRG